MLVYKPVSVASFAYMRHKSTGSNPCQLTPLGSSARPQIEPFHEALTGPRRIVSGGSTDASSVREFFQSGVLPLLSDGTTAMLSCNMPLPEFWFSDNLPEPEQFSIEGRERPTSPYSTYKRSKCDGTIIVNAYKRYRVVATDAYQLVGEKPINGDYTNVTGFIGGVPDYLVCPNDSIRYLHNPPQFQFEGTYRTSSALAGEMVYGYSDWLAHVRYQAYVGVPVSVFSSKGRPKLDALVNYLDSIPIPGHLSNDALDETYSGVYDVLTDLGELPETVKFVLTTCKEIILAYKKAKKSIAGARMRLSGKDLVSFIADKWMAFRYAVTPMIMSIQDVVKFSKNRDAVYVTSRKRDDTHFAFNDGKYDFTGMVERRAFVKARVRPSAITKHLGLNPLKTLYDLTPFSFIVDWVLPLGNMLGAAIKPAALDQVVMTHSLRVRNVLCSDGVHVDIDYYNSMPVKPRVRWPGLNVQITTKRKLDALALSWGLFVNRNWKSLQ